MGSCLNQKDNYIEIVITPFVLTTFFPLLEDFFVASPFRDMLRISEKSIPEILCAQPPAPCNAIYIISIPSYTIETMDIACGQFEPLVSTEIMLLVNDRSPLANKGFIEKKDIFSMPLIYYNEELLEDVIWHLFADTGKQDLYMKISDVRMIMQKVKKNEAVTITDALSVFLNKMPDHLVSTPIKDSVSLEVGILSRPDVVRTANEIAFIEFFKKCMRSICGPYLKQSSNNF